MGLPRDILLESCEKDIYSETEVALGIVVTLDGSTQLWNIALTKSKEGFHTYDYFPDPGARKEGRRFPLILTLTVLTLAC